MADWKNILSMLIDEAVAKKMSAQQTGGERQEWRPPMPFPSRDNGSNAITPVEAEIEQYMAQGSDGPMPWSYGQPDVFDQVHNRWAYGDGFGNPQKYGKYAGSYGGPEDDTIYREFIEDGRRVSGLEKRK